MVAVKNWGSVDRLPSLISSSVESFSVFGFHWVVCFGVVFRFVGVDRLFVTAVVDKLLVAAVDRLELDILEIDRLMTALLVGKQMGFDLGTDSEFGTGNRSFDIGFPIIGYLNADDSQFGYVFVYHNSGRYAFPVATVNWSMKMNGAWMQWTYMLQDAAAQTTDKLVEYLWGCEIVGVNCLYLAQISMEVSQAIDAVIVAEVS
ncbi:hypothetical protein G9A89_012423 [Geosiphon pyriformis]|nr:hypothetical protein G9A89_012423 [Geosiphon pyriformis]